MDQKRVMILNAKTQDIEALELVSNQYPERRYSFHYIDHLPEALENLSENRFDSIIVTDNTNSAGLVDIYRILHHSMPEIPIVILAESGNDPAVIQVLSEGADDIITRPEIDCRILERSLRYAIENKRRKEQIRRLLFTIEQIPASILIIDASGIIDYVNSQFIRITGYNRNDIIAENIYEINGNGIGNELFIKLGECVVSKKEWSGEIKNKKKNGELLWESTSISPIKNIDGVITHFVAISQDITQKKQEDAALRQSEERFRTVVHNINEYIYSVTYNNGVAVSTYHSPRCMEITGYTEEELGGDTQLWFSMVHNKDKDHVNSFINQIFTNKTTMSIEHRIIRKDGAVRWVSNTCAVQLDEKGDIWRLHGFLQDITERKEFEQKLVSDEKMLRLRNEKVEKDLKLAQLIQRSFLPKKIPKINDLISDYRYYPLDKVGGDFFSINTINKNTLSVFIGDVAGHGVSAALFLSLVKSATERIAKKYAQQPDRYITELNRILIEEMPSFFITAIYSLFLRDTEKNAMTFSFSNGGHPYPLHFSAAEDSYTLIRKSSTIVGMFEEVTYGTYNVALNRGDRIFMMTDGIPEAENEIHDMIGFEEGLTGLFRRSFRNSLSDTLDTVIEELNKFRGAVPPDDDIILMGFEVSTI
ncbi:MAG TPA: PAS domain S-box protein [Spirochaetota bacterium]|nr:PAS domain S-box protein [Spirochaetota bacterium]HQO01466.1 PAS domain S-box protein [Spirochaetota bacterium]HQP47172.1 PAS domain S-box protein [Spirochaetota bacterium]